MSDKKVDETWKSNVQKTADEERGAEQRRRIQFSEFVTSLAMQAMVQMGDLTLPDAPKTEPNYEAAQEFIDLLVMIKDKTKNNLNEEEDKLITSLIADLQIRFVGHKKS